MTTQPEEPEKSEADDILEIINDPEFDEWAHLLQPTDPALPMVSPHDTDADLPSVKP